MNNNKKILDEGLLSVNGFIDKIITKIFRGYAKRHRAELINAMKTSDWIYDPDMFIDDLLAGHTFIELVEEHEKLKNNEKAQHPELIPTKEEMYAELNDKLNTYINWHSEECTDFDQCMKDVLKYIHADKAFTNRWDDAGLRYVELFDAIEKFIKENTKDAFEIDNWPDTTNID